MVGLSVLRPDPLPVALSLQALLERGTQWREGGRDPATGVDCWGLTHWAFAQVGVILPDVADAAEAYFVPVAPPYQPWDVLLCRFPLALQPRHLLLLLAPPWGFHSSRATNGVARFCLYQAVWRRVVQQGWRYREWV